MKAADCKPTRLSYERLLQILNQLPTKEDSDYVLSFLLSNDRKLKEALANIKQEKSIWIDKLHEAKQRAKVAQQQVEDAAKEKRKINHLRDELISLRDSLNKKIAWIEDQRRQLAHFLPEKILNESLGTKEECFGQLSGLVQQEILEHRPDSGKVLSEMPRHPG